MSLTANGGRLTIKPEAGGKRFPIPDGNQTGNVVYLTQYTGNQIGLKTGGAWVLRTFTNEPSVSLSGLADGMYDIFARWSGSAVQLFAFAWTDVNNRSASHLIDREGLGKVLVKQSDDSYRYLGTVEKYGSVLEQAWTRTLFNYYNRATRPLSRDAVSGGPTTTLNNSATWANYAADVIRAVFDRTAMIRLVTHQVSYADINHASGKLTRESAPTIDSVNVSAPTSRAGRIDCDQRYAVDLAMSIYLGTHPRAATANDRSQNNYQHLGQRTASPSMACSMQLYLNRYTVMGHSKAARRGGVKSGHFAGSAIRRWSSATQFRLPETADGECPQDGDCSVDTTVARVRLVTAADRPRAGDRPRHGGATPTSAATGPKCGHSARRLGRVKCRHLFAATGSAAADGG